ncbi:MAG: glycosyltransferase family 2 protein [Desulfobulbus sp.]
MSRQPLATVIIPCFNAAHTLPEAIASVQFPGSEPVEIIIVDDGSTDNIKEVVEPLSKQGIARYIFKENGGVASARNLGLNLARGKYITFLDADDVMLPDSLRSRLDVFERFEHLDVVFGDYYLDSTERSSEENSVPVLSALGFPKIAAKYIEKQDGDLFLLNKNFHHYYLRATPRPIWTGAVMISKDIVNKRGLFNTRYCIGEDNDYWQRLILCSQVGYVNRPVARYLHHRSSLTKNTLRAIDDEIDYNNSISNFIKNDFLEFGKDYFFVKKKIGACFFEKAYFLYKQKNFKNSLCYSGKSIIAWPFSFKTIKITILSLFKFVVNRKINY